MRRASSILAFIVLLAASLSAEQPANDVALLPCPPSENDAPGCNPSRQELKQAQAAFAKGLKLQSAKRTEEAFSEFENAARFSPRNVEYVTAREMTRQQLVFGHVEQGNAQLLARKPVEAMAEFRHALSLDPQNSFAQQRLNEAAAEYAPRPSSYARLLDAGGEIHIAPSASLADFHIRGDGHTVLTQVAAAYGIKVTFDESVANRPVRFDLGGADFYAAMGAACAMTKSFWTPLGEKQILLAAESTENHRSFDRMAMRTFYIPDITNAQGLNELNNLLRGIFDIRFVSPQPNAGTIVVRAPQDILDAATTFLENLDNARPQAMLDVRIYQISHSLTRNMGLQIPNQFKLFNIPVGALAALGGQNIQDLINQLFSSGGINQGNNTALSALLAQLQGQQNSIFSQPVATFGGGLTFMGLSLGTAGAQLSMNESWVQNLEHATMRVAQGVEANFRLGIRYPILNATFAPVFNSAAISQVIQNNSFTAAFPSFNYEDIGLSIKAKPSISGNNNIALQLEMQFRSLNGQSENGVPEIANREYKGSINLKEGEPAVVAGSVSSDEQRSLNGIPGFGAVPGLNHIMTSNSKQEDEDELLIVITPHLVRGQEHDQTSEIWLPK